MAPSDPRQEARDAHALAIGRIVVAWNEYQEHLSELYGALFSRRDWKLAIASWHALDNDRAQRAMLLAAAKRKLKSNSRALEEIEWIVKRTDQLIADQRNTGIHMPIMSFTELDGTHHILPHTMLGHSRALRMVGKDLLKEYGHYEKQIRKMTWYAGTIAYNLTPRPRRRSRVVWEDRPRLTAGA